jgi:phosphomannomutase
MTPTPFVPYSVLKHKCAAGVMVTASHNPKEDNGFKVYFDNGAQVCIMHESNTCVKLSVANFFFHQRLLHRTTKGSQKTSY